MRKCSGSVSAMVDGPTPTALVSHYRLQHTREISVFPHFLVVDMLLLVLLTCICCALSTEETFFSAARMGNTAEVTNYLNNGE